MVNIFLKPFLPSGCKPSIYYKPPRMRKVAEKSQQMTHSLKQNLWATKTCARFPFEHLF